jgi:hypothetical protein
MSVDFRFGFVLPSAGKEDQQLAIATWQLAGKREENPAKSFGIGILGGKGSKMKKSEGK